MQVLVEVMITATFDNHFYKWEGNLYKQESGGPVGLRATGSCAKLVMDNWLEAFKRKLEENNVKIYLLRKYVDDVMIVTRNFELGSYWNGTKVKWNRWIKERHKKSGISRSKLTLDIYKQMANSIHSFLKFTGEVSDSSEPIPCLDTQCWVGKASEKIQKWYDGQDAPETQRSEEGGHTILYKFYKKPMASKMGMLGRSAQPEQMKVTTAVEELLRRWRNTSMFIAAEEVEEITKSYMDDLTGMGYSLKWRLNVVRSALVGYERKLKSGENRHRSGASSRKSRRVKKLVGQRIWFTKGRKEAEGKGNAPGVRKIRKPDGRTVQEDVKRTESCVFVPHTPHSELKRRLTEMEKNLNLTTNYKYVEELGSSLADLLVRADPWAGHCGRKDCFPCKNFPGKCGIQGVVYDV